MTESSFRLLALMLMLPLLLILALAVAVVGCGQPDATAFPSAGATATLPGS